MGTSQYFISTSTLLPVVNPPRLPNTTVGLGLLFHDERSVRVNDLVI